MHKLCVPLILALLVSLVSAGEKPAADESRIDRLVKQLSDRHYRQREEADRALRKTGEPALPALRKALQSPDAEVRQRATRLIRLIEQQADSSRLLAPKRLRLVCKDMPIPEAVEKLAREAGIPIKLEGDREALARSRLTLDTGATTFWKALDLLCAKAGLVESETRPEMPGGQGGSVVIVRGRGARVTPRDITETQGTPVELTLKAGKSASLPTHHSGAVRVRALPPGTPIGEEEKTEGEILLGLQAKAGPGLAWKRAVGLRILKAVDEKGQSLVALPFRSAKAPAPARGRSVVIINGIPISSDQGDPGSDQGLLPVRLKTGAKPSKKLAELSGTIVASVQSPPLPLVEIKNVLKAKGQTFKGARGGSVKVVETSRGENGEIQLRIQVQTPAGQVNDGTAAALGNATIIINGRPIGPREEPLSAANFRLGDEKGRSLKVTQAVDTGVRAGTAREIELTFESAAKLGVAGPLRFVFLGRRGAVVEVPFVLKDVPLP
jgi:hypothetical protein